jgi:hypothetical protein
MYISKEGVCVKNWAVDLLRTPIQSSPGPPSLFQKFLDPPMRMHCFDVSTYTTHTILKNMSLPIHHPHTKSHHPLHYTLLFWRMSWKSWIQSWLWSLSRLNLCKSYDICIRYVIGLHCLTFIFFNIQTKVFKRRAVLSMCHNNVSL